MYAQQEKETAMRREKKTENTKRTEQNIENGLNCNIIEFLSSSRALLFRILAPFM